VTVPVRAAHEDEAGLLLAIQREAAIAAYAHVFPQERYPFPDAAIRAEWEAALRDPEVEVYVTDDEPLGTVSIGHGYLRTLYVVPAAWRRGIGSALHDHALARLRERGVGEARLWTLAENSVARAFYERRGWRLTTETRVVPYPPHPLDVQYVHPF
jgi:GNAT superfamily N-acetyltransferase